MGVSPGTLTVEPVTPSPLSRAHARERGPASLRPPVRILAILWIKTGCKNYFVLEYNRKYC